MRNSIEINGQGIYWCVDCNIKAVELDSEIRCLECGEVKFKE